MAYVLPSYFGHFVLGVKITSLTNFKNDFNSSFSELLEMANETTIYIKNLKFLLTEVYKFLNGLSPPIINKVFQTNDCPYDLRNPRILSLKQKSTIKHGISTIAFKIAFKFLKFGKTFF